MDVIRRHKGQSAAASTRFISFLCLAAIMLSAAVLAIASEAPKARTLTLSSDPNFHQEMVRYVEFALDPSLERQAEAMFADESSFAPFTSRYIDAGLTSARVWLRFSAVNPHDEEGLWRIDIQRQYMKEIEVYIRRGETIEKLLSHNDSQPFHDRTIPNRFQQSDFRMDAGEKAEFLIGYRSSSTTFLPVYVGMPDAATQEHAGEALIDWFINGALLAMVILALLLIPVTGWRLGLSFALYICAGMFYVANADGYTFEYIWPEQPWLNDPMNLMAILLMPASALHFARQLFAFANVSPRFDRLLILAISVTALTALLAVPLYEVRSFMIGAYWLVPIATLIQLSCGIVALRNGRVGSAPYTIGAALVVSSFAYATIAHIVPGAFNLDSTLDYGHVVLFSECIAFAVAIMLRILALRDERDKAQEEALEAAHERLRLSEALVESQRNYSQAKHLSEERTRQLSNVSHDIRQPLLALRTALGNIRGQNEGVTAQMNAAFDYLEGIAVSPKEAANSLSLGADNAAAKEDFTVNVVLDNVTAIYESQAAAAGKSMEYCPSKAQVSSDPVELMRMVSNCVSNAIKHGGKRVSLTATESDDGVRIEVWDDGLMSQDELSLAMERGEKHAQSDGEGLGLAIVRETAEQLGLTFELQSAEGVGTIASIHLPASQ